MLVKKDNAETLTSDHQLLRDIPSFKPSATHRSKRNTKKQSERNKVSERNKLKEQAESGRTHAQDSQTCHERRWKG
jgi:hypothetical protein